MSIDKVYITTDIEGIAGWAFYASRSGSIWNFKHLERLRYRLTTEVNVAIRACKELGATEVYVYDNHGCSYNIIFSELESGCRIIHGRSGYFPSITPLLDSSFDAAICLGMHAMAGTKEAVCPHSCWHLVTGDGKELKLSECTMFAALAGEMGVPLVAMSGDDKIAAEVTEKIPKCETAVVKQGLAPQNACSLDPVRASELIATKVKAGLSKLDEIDPFVLKGPFTLNVSDRDPTIKELSEDLSGHNLKDVVHEVSRTFGNKWGDQSIDDRSWRYPDNVYE